MNNRISIGLAGDVMIGRNVDTAITRNGNIYPWGNMQSLLRSTDINIINLETTLTNSAQTVHKTFHFKAAPDKIKTLTEARITAVNLANNHILDFSEEGLRDTLSILNAAGIKYAGAGMDDREAAATVVLGYGNIRLGMLGFTDNEPGWQAGPFHAGINYIDLFKAPGQEKALSCIQQLAKEVDIVIVSIHWGPNMKEAPNPVFIEFAHKMIDHGADIIHGHSAHIFQGIEIYKNKLILYDTGDFLDDYAVDPILKNDCSFFFIVEAGKKEIYRLKLIPVSISKCQVNHAMADESIWSIRRMKQLSSGFGTRITDSGEVILSGNTRTETILST